MSGALSPWRGPKKVENMPGCCPSHVTLEKKNRIVNEEWKEIPKNGDPWCQDGMVAGNSMERWDVIAG